MPYPSTRKTIEARHDPATRPGALKRIADQLGVHPEALRTRVKQLERENRELRRANTILKQASAPLAAEIDPHRADRGVRRCSPR